VLQVVVIMTHEYTYAFQQCQRFVVSI